MKFAWQGISFQLWCKAEYGSPLIPKFVGMTILHELYLHYTTLVHTGGEEEEV